MTAVHALGDWRTEQSRYVRIAGAWRKVVGVSTHVAGAWRTANGYAPAFSATAPTGVRGYQNTPRPAATLVSASAAITISGGIPPYSYAWSQIDGDNRIVAQSPAMASTDFSASLLDETAVATFGWQATDAAGQTQSGSTVVRLTAETD